MGFKEKLHKSQKENNSLLCIGLDPIFEKIPEHIRKECRPLFTFNKAIIDATADLVSTYKPNSAFYEALGENGIEQLKQTCDYILMQHPHIPIILDAKRGDIDSSNVGYIKYVFEYLQADAVTLHPYLGKEALWPFLEMLDKGIFILCKTSNKGGGELQDIKVKGIPLYKIIAEKIVHQWNENSNCMMVVGATYPEELQEIRAIAGDMTFLIPGIGSQGGSIEETVKAGKNSRNNGMIINSSRGIIFASNGRDFAEKARQEALKLRDEINKFRI